MPNQIKTQNVKQSNVVNNSYYKRRLQALNLCNAVSQSSNKTKRNESQIDLVSRLTNSVYLGGIIDRRINLFTQSVSVLSTGSNPNFILL